MIPFINPGNTIANFQHQFLIIAVGHHNYPISLHRDEAYFEQKKLSQF